MSPSKQLIEFVNSLPVGPAYAPIYAKGVVFGKHENVSKGKSPHEKAHYTHFSPSDVALLLEKEPERFSAIGLYTGIWGGGLVILDVDANLASLSKKWGDSLQDAPKIISTKKNAAKFVFRVPEEQRAQVKGITGKETGQGYEVLWGMQGLIGGTYPGSSDGKYPAGTYRLVQGDLYNIPLAPEWLLAEMRARKLQDTPPQAKGLVKNRKGLDFNGRTEDEIAEIVHDCLQVMPHLGRGSEDYWWQIGAMIAEVLPNELGLTLWSAWSSSDPDFEDDWTKGDPCAAKWPLIVAKAGKPGNVGLGSLIKQADYYDPKRERFQDSSRKTLDEVEKDQVQRFQQVALEYSEVVERAKALLSIDNPAEMNYRMHCLAVEAGYRDAEKIDRILIDHMAYENQSDAISLKKLLETDFNRAYLIPDLLPKPSVVLMYGTGGDGKSMAAWTLLKHISTGAPFVIRGQLVPVEQGPVLILNGDQPMVQLQEQLEEVDVPIDAPVTIRTDFQLQRFAYFCKQVQKYKPSLVIIDSLIGCSGGKAFDENKSEFAQPLYWLTRNNGVMFPATTIVVIHHANKSGGFRGTSSIRDAVDEVWSLKKPDEKQIEQTGQAARILTIEKSRSGRGGTQLLMKQEQDLSFTLSDWTPEVDPSNASPSGITDRVLQRLRVVYPACRTQKDLVADPLCGGSIAGVKKSVQRLLKRGLIVEADKTNDGSTGRPRVLYQAVLSRGEIVNVCPFKVKPSAGTGSDGGQEGGHKGCVSPDDHEHPGTPNGDTAISGSEECPPSDPLRRKESTQKGTFGIAIHARVREEFSDAELDDSMGSALSQWD